MPIKSVRSLWTAMQERLKAQPGDMAFVQRLERELNTFPGPVRSEIEHHLRYLARKAGKSLQDLKAGRPFAVYPPVMADAVTNITAILERAVHARRLEAVEWLTRELDAIEAKAKMTASYERVLPRIISVQQSGIAFDFIIYHLESDAWFSPRYNDIAIEGSVSLFRPDDVIFDLGCNSGFHSVWMAKHAHLGQVHAFDPFPWNTTATQAQAKLNGLGNITTHGVGVGERDAKLNVRSTSSKTFDPDVTGETLAIEVHSIERYRYLNPTFLKIDIEGAEQDLAETPLLSWPSIRAGYVEMHPEFIAQGGKDPASFIERLIAEGFSVQLYDGLPIRQRPEKVFPTAYYFQRH